MSRLYQNVAAIGMDVHYKFSKVAFRDPNARVIRHERLEHLDRDSLVLQTSRWPRGVPIVMESSFGWAWLNDILVDQGHAQADIHLANCFKVANVRQARYGIKTDRKDADFLSLLPFEHETWWRVTPPPREVRDYREWLRLRSERVGMRTMTKNRIHALFHRHGLFCEASDLFGQTGRAFLQTLCAGAHPELQGRPREVLQAQMRTLDWLDAEIEAQERDLKDGLAHNPVTRRLTTCPGVGLILSHTLASEIGQLERFGNHSALASYSLVAPINNETGVDPTEVDRDQKGRHIGHRGNHILKWAWIEAAHGAVRCDAGLREYFNRHTDGGQNDRGRGYIKVARKLVKIIYAMWRDEREYQERPPKRSRVSRSTRRSGRSPRSGTGRIFHPMTAAGSSASGLRL